MNNYTHPDILQMERCGYLYGEKQENVLLGDCEECGESVYSDICGDAYKTDSGMIFCCEECCHDFFGIRSVDA